MYRCGFAGSQAAYERAYDRLFARLDWLSERLRNQRYLVGDTITEADVRLFTTLARFDAVYHGHFKCNRQKLTELPVLWAYARDLFQTPGFGDTIDFVHIKRHYYVVHTDINPTGIVPAGPDLAGWLAPHGREELGGRRSATAPRPAPRPPRSACPPPTARRPRPDLAPPSARCGLPAAARITDDSSWRRSRTSFGRRLAVAPRVGVEHPLVGLPLQPDARQVAGPGVGPHPQRDQLLVAGEHLEALPGGPEHAVDVAHRQVVAGQLGRRARGQQHEVRRDPLGVGPQVAGPGERHVADQLDGRAQRLDGQLGRLQPGAVEAGSARGRRR